MLFLFVTSCEQEDFLVQEEYNIKHRYNLNIEEISFNEFQSDINMKDQVSKFYSVFDINIKEEVLKKDVYSKDSSFVVLIDKILKVSTNSTESYSFQIKDVTKSSSAFENFVIEKTNNTFKYLIYRFKRKETQELFPYFISRTEVTEDQINAGYFPELFSEVAQIDICLAPKVLEENGELVVVWMIVDCENFEEDGTESSGSESDSGSNSGTNSGDETNTDSDNGHGTGGNTNNSENDDWNTGNDSDTNNNEDENSSGDNGNENASGFGGSSSTTNSEDTDRAPIGIVFEDCDGGLKDADGNCLSEADILNNALNEDSPYTVDMSTVLDSINLPTPDSTKIANEKFLCVYKKLTTSNTFKNLFVNTFGDSDKFNVTFEIVDDLPSTTSGNTGGTSTFTNGDFIGINMTIKINKNNLLSNSSFIVARTILHESIHAYLKLKLRDCNAGTILGYINNLELGETINEFYDNFNCAGPLQSQHEFMFDYMLPTFQNVFTEIGNTNLTSQTSINNVESSQLPLQNNSSVDWNWQDFYYYFSMQGLHNTEAFKNEIENDSNENDLYNAYIEESKRFTKTCN